MNPNDDRVEAIFHAALELSGPGEREALLKAECGDDLALEARVRRLIAMHEDSRGLPESAPLSTGIASEMARLKPEEAGERIGPYKLLQQIGEGGFGVVWMAEQEQPVRRRVALKIIKMGMDTKEVIARFEQERQALAMMEHPNIAKVFDAGATQYGRPFFVMELVRGVKITDYCDQQELATAERLALFIHVCQAVQHAHQKGIIHRDLKPSNILVTINDGEPVPKVIDFGVAKATQGRLTDATLFTQFEQMVGTPLYMSPEQAELTSLDIDTRSDIYSLGVLLYELLTGRTPIDTATMAQAGMDEIRRIIREVDPPRPSARVKTLDGNELTTTAKRRHTDAAKLPGALRGDLDWIVMKCLEKDRKRRYDTATGLAQDLQRHLANEIVTARPPTASYLLGKLIRRNKLAFAAGAAIAASLIIGLAATGWQAVRANRALHELRATAPAFAEQARGLVAKERFDEALEKLAYATKLRPDAPEYLVAKGDVLQSQLRLAEAAAAYRGALALHHGDARAQAGAALCDELLAAPKNPGGKLTRETLSKLHLAMQQQQRPAAELMPVARLLGEEKKLIVDYWLARLRELPIAPDRPLEKRLTVRDDGRLALDLSETKVTDLTPLAGAPLAVLNATGASELTSIAALRGMSLSELHLARTKVADLSPLRDMRTLEKLHLKAAPVSDLSPLQGLRLRFVDLADCPVSDLGPLRGAPVEEIVLANTRVADLSPLAGMPLRSLELCYAPVIDFRPLAGLPLEVGNFEGNRLNDLAVLRGMPLRELSLWHCVDARNYAVLAEIKTLELLLLPSAYRTLPEPDLAAIGALRTHPRLRQLGSEIMDGMNIVSTGAKEIFWHDWDREQSFVPALRKAGFHFELSKHATGKYFLRLEKQTISDLTPLKGAPISDLWLGSCKVTDLTPIHDLPLRILGLAANPQLEDLRPLRGMRLEELSLEYTKVSDLAPLTGLPLKKLYLHSCDQVTDVSPLAEIATLEKLTVPMNARNIEVLRKLPNVKWLDFGVDPKNAQYPASTAERFWEMWPTLAWRQTLNEAGIKYTAQQDAGKLWEVTVTGREFRDCSIFKGARISKLTLDDTAVTDLAPLAGLPLKSLSLRRTAVKDLSPLAGFALENLSVKEMDVTDISVLRRAPLCDSLEKLWLERLKVTDFSSVAACKGLSLFGAAGTPIDNLEPLRGRPLRELYLAATQVSDLSVLAGMPLERLIIDQTPVTDLTPLLTLTQLETLILPAKAENIEALRTLPMLSRISFSYDPKISGPSMTAAEFWASLPARGAQALVAANRYADAEPGLAETLASARKRAGDGHPDTLPALLDLANCRAWAGRYREAAPLFQEIIDLRKPAWKVTPDTLEMVDWFSLALMHAATGDAEKYRAVCGEMLHRCEGTRSDSAAERALLYSSVAPGGSGRTAQVRELIESARPMEKTTIAYWFRLAVGLAEYRTGDFAAAAELLKKVELVENSPSSVMADLTLAMIAQRTGDAADAALRLQRNRAPIAAHWPLRQERAVDVSSWPNWLAAEILLRETEALLASPAAKAR